MHVGLPDVQHVHLRAGHHDADQSGVLGPGSLLKEQRVGLDCATASSTNQPAHEIEINALRIAIKD